MHQETIKAIAREVASEVTGHALGNVHQLSPLTLVLDFRLREGNYLLISVEPKHPRMHLVRRRLRDLEKASMPPDIFVQALRSKRRAKLLSLKAHESERIVSLHFARELETGAPEHITLLVQLTGRSSNLYLLNAEDVITHALRSPKGEGQQVGQHYQAPPVQAKRGAEEDQIEIRDFPSLSAAADEYYTRLESAEQFTQRVQAARDRIRREIDQRKKLRKNLLRDQESHGDAEEHKRLGDLLLANIAGAKRAGTKVQIVDYYSPGTPTIELEIDEKSSLQEAAARCFIRYGKSKRAQEEITKRLAETEKELAKLEQKTNEIERIQRTGDESALSALEHARAPVSLSGKAKELSEKIPGVRRYKSSDGYEILVGRAAHTNDQLTFKVAKPHDLWLHSADYPGSHVVVRNTSRKEFPQRTIIEAAQLAAKFSQASEDSKVNVNYTQRKFLSKPRGAAPGLVRMSSFKTITVVPGENVERIL